MALIPTTIGALLSAIGIAGIDRTMRFHMLAMSGKAVEAAGDVQTLILDKTGTITTGDREATDYSCHCLDRRARSCSRLAFRHRTSTPRPKADRIVALSHRGAQPEPSLPQAQGLDFSAETRMSGTNFPNGRSIRKGAVAAVTIGRGGPDTSAPADVRGSPNRRQAGSNPSRRVRQ